MKPKKHSPPQTKKPIVAIIGAGAVGSTIAYTAAIRNIAAEILLIDSNERKEEGEVMDMSDALCFVETGSITGATYTDAKNADVLVITAGLSQKTAKTTRLELLEKNVGILVSIFKSIGSLKPGAIVLIVSNPVDILTAIAQKISGLPRSQVFGSGTTLDSVRLASVLAAHYHVSPQDVHGFILGEHGDSSLVAWSSVCVGGVPISDMPDFTRERADAIEQTVKREAYEIIARKGATYYGIGLTATNILEAIIYNQKRILPVSHELHRWNGVSNVCISAPAVVGMNGIEKTWPLSLTKEEQQKFIASANVLKSYMKKQKKLFRV